MIEDVLIEGDRIVAVGRDLAVPRGVRIVNARGLTLIPGLHDLHTHLRSPAFNAPEDMAKSYASYLLRGVTTVNDYSVSGEMLQPIREMVSNGAVSAPHLQLAIRLGVPGGHGTEFGSGNFFTFEAATPRAAHLMMLQALSYKPDVIKVFADGWRYGRDADLNSMNEPTLAAIVEDAHAAHLPVLTHTVTLGGAKIGAAAGIDALGHGVSDAPVDADLIAKMKSLNTGYVATMVVFEPQENRTFLPGEWSSLRPGEKAREKARLAKPIKPIPAYEAKRWATLQDNMRRLHAAGIRIGIGTDSGIGGVYHGSGTIREITILTKLGFTPAQALVAATWTSADILGQADDHGTIVAGKRADLVLVGGKPDERIDDLWNVRRVWVSGSEVDLPKLRSLVESNVPTPLPVHKMAGPIDTGARADGRTDLDTLPVESTEPGVDHSRLDMARDDEGPAKRMFLVARLGAAPEPFAQLILPLTRGAIQLADARGFTGVAFTAKGAGKYGLTLESYGLTDDAWFRAPFRAGEGRAELRIPFAQFASPEKGAKLDLSKLRSLIVRLEGQPGAAAWLQLSDVRFYR